MKYLLKVEAEAEIELVVEQTLSDEFEPHSDPENPDYIIDEERAAEHGALEGLDQIVDTGREVSGTRVLSVRLVKLGDATITDTRSDVHVALHAAITQRTEG